jgi:hypothetical protein
MHNLVTTSLGTFRVVGLHYFACPGVAVQLCSALFCGMILLLCTLFSNPHAVKAFFPHSVPSCLLITFIALWLCAPCASGERNKLHAGMVSVFLSVLLK